MIELVIRGPGGERRLPITHEIVIGRSDADVVVDEAEVSRRHSAIRPTQGGLQVEDLGSTNGTWVNGVRISSATALREGDVVRVGATELVVSLGAPPVQPVQPAQRPQPAPPVQPVEPVQPSAFAAPAGRRGRRVATRAITPIVLSLGAILVTAILLIAYFSLR